MNQPPAAVVPAYPRRGGLTIRRGVQAASTWVTTPHRGRFGENGDPGLDKPFCLATDLQGPHPGECPNRFSSQTRTTTGVLLPGQVLALRTRAR